MVGAGSRKATRTFESNGERCCGRLPQNLGCVSPTAEGTPMGLGFKQDKPTELELRSAALEADEHFRGLPLDVQNLKRSALVEDYGTCQHIKRVGLQRYQAAIIRGVGMLILFWGMGSAPHLNTFAAAVVLGVLLGAGMELIEGGTILFALGCGLSAFLLGTMTGTFVSVFIMPIAASYLGAVIGTMRWL